MGLTKNLWNGDGKCGMYDFLTRQCYNLFIGLFTGNYRKSPCQVFLIIFYVIKSIKDIRLSYCSYVCKTFNCEISEKVRVQHRRSFFSIALIFGYIEIRVQLDKTEQKKWLLKRKVDT